jgi:hypothetical protein
MREVEMANDCYQYLTRNRTYATVVREVPFLSRCIDLVFFNQCQETVTIEFKMKNWRHAIEQVKTHRLGADRVYICLPIKTPSSALIHTLTSENIGLFLYCPQEEKPMTEYLPAPVNVKKVDLFNKLLVDKVRRLSQNPSPEPL